MHKQHKLTVFWLDQQRFALHLSNIEKIIRIVEVIPLPKASDYILGIINFHGEFLPVLNTRRIFSIPNREIDLTDQLIVIRTKFKKVALWVDDVSDIVQRSDDEIINTDKILLDIDHIKGIFKLEDGMVLLHDLERFLELEKITLLKETIDDKKRKKKVKENKIKNDQLSGKRKKKVLSGI